MEKSDKKIVIRLSIITVIVIIGFILLSLGNSAVTGHAIAKDVESDQKFNDYLKSIDFLKYGLEDIESRVSSCYDLNQLLLDKLQENSKELTECKLEKEQLNASHISELNKKDTEISELNSQLGDLQEDLDGKNKEYDKLSDDYNKLVGNTAITVCCKAKVDNPLIKYYKIDDDRIVCSTQSGTQLNCSF